MSAPQNELIFLSLDDIVALFKKNYKKLKKAALIGGFAALAFLLSIEPRYVAKGSFKQASGKKESMASGVAGLLQNIGLESSESSATGIMRSRRMMRDVVKKLGLQISPAESPSRWQKYFSSSTRNVLIELNRRILLKEEFIFRDVHYDCEEPISFSMRFDTKEHFEILDEKERVLAKGFINETITWADAQLTVSEVPSTLELQKKYPFQLAHWVGAADGIVGGIEIKPSEIDTALLLISYACPNPRLAAAIVNQTMESFQGYLKEENDESVEFQLAYLEKRQRELMQKLDKTFKEHVSYLRRGIGEKGRFALMRDIEDVDVSLEKELSNKLLEVEVELRRLDGTSIARSNDSVPKSIDEGEVLEEKILSCSALLKQAEEGHQVTKEQLHLLPVVKGDASSEPSRLIERLRHHLEYLTKKREIVRENVDLCNEFKRGFQGMDLLTAKEIYLSYVHEIDRIHAHIKQLLFVRQQIDQEDFELSSLGDVLKDAVSGTMLAQAGQLAIELCDEHNHSSKDLERIKNALAGQKRFIGQHIEQIVELDKLRAQLIEDKIAALLEVKKELFVSEKEILEDKMDEMRVAFAEMPETWRLMQKLKLEKELGLSTIQGVAHITESKIVNHQLFQVESKPLDLARIPVTPKAPHLILFSFLGASAGVLLLFGFELTKGLFQGLPISSATLRAHRQRVLGSLSPLVESPFTELPKEDLETLRLACQFVSGKQNQRKLLALLAPTSEDLARHLATLFSLQGAKTLIVQCDFDAVISPKDTPGFWHYLQNQQDDVTFQQETMCDYLPMGNTDRYGTELMQRERFTQFLEKYQARYDLVILCSRASLFSTEAQQLSQSADMALLVTRGERVEEVAPYFHLGKVAFLIQK